MVSRSGINKLEVSWHQFVGGGLVKTPPTHHCSKTYSFSLSHDTHVHTCNTQQNRPDVRVHAFFPPHTPPPPTAPQRRRVVCHCCTILWWCNDYIMCSLNLILFLTIYSNTVTSSYHHHVACWGQSLYCTLVILCVQFFNSFHPDSLINYYYLLMILYDQQSFVACSGSDFE